MVLKKYKLINVVALVVTLFFLYFQLTTWQTKWLGWILFFIFLFLNGELWKDIWRRVFGLNRKIWSTKILAMLSVFFLLGIFSAICLVFYRLTPTIIFGVYLAVALFSYALRQLLQKLRIANEDIIETAPPDFAFLKSSYLILLIYVVLWLLAFYWLVFLQKPSMSVAQSPWQIINNNYLWLFFVLTVLSGLFLLAKYKIKVILLVLVMQTLLLHFYLPISHQMPWGGDVWRHLAVENQLNNRQPILPVLIGEEAEWQEVANVKLPSVFFNPQKYAYGHLWGTSVLLSQTLVVDLLQINIWLMPILWSIALPLLLFRIGTLLFGYRRAGLWLIWLSLLPFPLQVLGSLSLPVSLGLLLFLFTLMMWLQYWREDEIWQKHLAILFSVLMLFSYTLFFILIWTVILLSAICYLLSAKFQIANSRQQIAQKIWVFILMIVSIFVIPVIELVSHISYFTSNINWLGNLKQLVGQFSGWFYATLVRPHDILSGNLLFNHTPDYAFTQNVFNAWRYWLIPTMIIIWLLVIWGMIKAWCERSRAWQAIGLLSLIVFSGYIIGWFGLVGDRLLTRRLDVILVFLIIILLFKSLSQITYHLSVKSIKWKVERVMLMLLILFLSFFTTFTYASGPDMRVVSVDEYNAAQMIVNKLQVTSYKLQDKFCVLSDTWVLLPLESLSNGSIIGGGFPIDYQFGQNERVALFNKFSINPEAADLLKMKQLTGANQCWFAQNGNNLDLDRVSKIMNSAPEQVGEIFVWKDLPSITTITGLKNKVK